MWIFLIIFIISGLGNIHLGNPVIGVIFILIGITLCPLIKIKKSTRIIIIVICLFAAAGSVDVDPSNIPNE